MAASMSSFLRTMKRPQVYGMIHVSALPGSPLASMSVSNICEKVRKEAELYAKCGVDGIVLENMHDIPYQLPSKIGPEVVACMTRACLEVKQLFGKERNKFKCGVQVLAGANKQAMSVAQSAEFDFIRAEGFVFSHVADEGLINACAGDLLRYRKQIGAENISIFADIKKKHSSHAITSDVSTLETVKAAQFFLADGVIITGTSTGEVASENELKELRAKCSFPILIGSGITLKNAKSYKRANAFIVGSYFKAGGLWFNELDHFKIKELMNFVKNDFS